ncbi:unnamed protein product [Cunninghamella blakesleeana]
MSRKRKKHSSQSKDQFINLAYEAIQEAELEEDRKGVIEEVIDALINATDLPSVAEVITEQLSSQDVIERTAEKHFIQEEEERISRTATPDLYQSYKESPPPPSASSISSSLSSLPHDLSLTSSFINDDQEPKEILKNEDIKEEDEDNDDDNNNNKESHFYNINSITKKNHINDISDYLWRFFRLLILACLVALLYQYYQHYSTYFSFLLS